MSPSGTSPVPGSRYSVQSSGGSPGVRSNIGNDSTSVARSVCRVSRLSARMVSSPQMRTLISHGAVIFSSFSAARMQVRICFLTGRLQSPRASQVMTILCSMLISSLYTRIFCPARRASAGAPAQSAHRRRQFAARAGGAPRPRPSGGRWQCPPYFPARAPLLSDR